VVLPTENRYAHTALPSEDLTGPALDIFGDMLAHPEADA